jgi:hypothetical protein
MENRVFVLEKVFEAASIMPVLSDNNEVFKIDSSASIKEAINYIDSHNYKLIYINIDFLDISIIPIFVALINNNFVGHIIFSGDYKNPSVVKKMGEFKSVDVLIKPFDGTWLKNAIIEHFKTGKPIGNESKNILSPYFIFRLISYENGNIALKINFNGKKGFIIFESGFVVHAKYTDKEGKEALRHIIKDHIPSNKKNVKITTPGLFAKKNIQINISSILEDFDSSHKTPILAKSEPKKINSELISYMYEKIELFYSGDNSNIIENTINEMGFSIDLFPKSEEIELIEKISEKIKNMNKSIEFKKCMMNFIIGKEKGC